MGDKNSSSNNNPAKNRIVSLVIGFLILFVVTFSLGVLVGKGLTERSLTFTEKVETVPSRDRVPEKTVESEYDEASVMEKRTSGSDTDIEAEESPIEISTRVPDEALVKENIKDGSSIEVPDPVETPKDQKADSDQRQSLTKTQSTVKSDPVREKLVATPEPQKKTTKAAIEEIAKTDQNNRESRVKLPPIDPNGSYTVQIGSFTDKKAAESVLRSMKNKGYPAYISTMTTSDAKKWYRVRIGTFESNERATDYGENLKILEPEVKIVFITQNN